LLELDRDLTTAYLDKFPEKKGKWFDDIFVSIDPVWWRYTNWEKLGKKPFIMQMV
jgi:hypothetical protein